MEYKKTLFACYKGYVVQAIINNLAPVLFTTFAWRYGIEIEKIAILILINFCTQIVADVFSVLFVDRIGLRRAAVAAHILAAIGLIAMAVLPLLLPSAFAALCTATVVCSIGGGLLEVLVSPIVNLIPSNAKAASMSLLHSFYCWGQVAVVLFSTLFLRIFGTENWFILPLLWAILPIFNTFSFVKAALPPALPAGQVKGLGVLYRKKIFWLGMVLMVAAGASELGMSQWSSAFAEAGLGVNKLMGDLLGPCLFAVFMGAGRTIYGICGAKIPLQKAMLACAALCVICYLTAALAPWPLVSLAGCALCGLAVSLFWPGVFSLYADTLRGGTPMFGVFAIMGDVGCALGPWLVGSVAGWVGGLQYLSVGLLVGTVFPLVMLCGVAGMRRAARHKASKTGIEKERA